MYEQDKLVSSQVLDEKELIDKSLNLNDFQDKNIQLDNFDNRTEVKENNNIFWSIMNFVGRENIRAINNRYGPLPEIKRPKNGYRARIIELIKENFKSGFTLSLVGIPLSLSLAIASSADPCSNLF